MNTQDLLDKIEKKLQDKPAFNRSTDLLPLLNEGLLFTARQRPLPELRTQNTVLALANQNQADLPEDYHIHLFEVYNVDRGHPCRLCYSLNTLIRMYGNDLNPKGKVEAVATEGDAVLHFRRTPEVDPEELRLTYYKKPAVLTDAEDSVPTCIPVALRRQILVNYVLWQAFEDIEEGMEGPKVNTQYFASEYAAGTMLLERFLPDVSRPRYCFPRKARTF